MRTDIRTAILKLIAELGRESAKYERAEKEDAILQVKKEIRLRIKEIEEQLQQLQSRDQ